MTDDIPDGTNGFCIMAIDITSFLPLEKFKDLIERMREHIKSTPAGPDGGEILVPGEREFRTCEERRKNGIPIDQVTWQQVQEAASLVGVEI